MRCSLLLLTTCVVAARAQNSNSISFLYDPPTRESFPAGPRRPNQDELAPNRQLSQGGGQAGGGTRGQTLNTRSQSASFGTVQSGQGLGGAGRPGLSDGPQNARRPGGAGRPGLFDGPQNARRPGGAGRPGLFDGPQNARRPGGAGRPGLSDGPQNARRPGGAGRPGLFDGPQHARRPGGAGRPGLFDGPQNARRPGQDIRRTLVKQPRQDSSQDLQSLDRQQVGGRLSLRGGPAPQQDGTFTAGGPPQLGRGISPDQALQSIAGGNFAAGRQQRQQQAQRGANRGSSRFTSIPYDDSDEGDQDGNGSEKTGKGVDTLSELLAKSTFKCKSSDTGYFADDTVGCQVFHYCAAGVKHSWVCPEGQLFHQINLICMLSSSDNMCKKSSEFRFVNDYLYKKVGDVKSGKPQYAKRFSLDDPASQERIQDSSSVDVFKGNQKSGVNLANVQKGPGGRNSQDLRVNVNGHPGGQGRAISPPEVSQHGDGPYDSRPGHSQESGFNFGAHPGGPGRDFGAPGVGHPGQGEGPHSSRPGHSQESGFNFGAHPGGPGRDFGAPGVGHPGQGEGPHSSRPGHSQESGFNFGAHPGGPGRDFGAPGVGHPGQGEGPHSSRPGHPQESGFNFGGHPGGQGRAISPPGEVPQHGGGPYDSRPGNFRESGFNFGAHPGGPGRDFGAPGVGHPGQGEGPHSSRLGHPQERGFNFGGHPGGPGRDYGAPGVGHPGGPGRDYGAPGVGHPGGPGRDYGAPGEGNPEQKGTHSSSPGHSQESGINFGGHPGGPGRDFGAPGVGHPGGPGRAFGLPGLDPLNGVGPLPRGNFQQISNLESQPPFNGQRRDFGFNGQALDQQRGGPGPDAQFRGIQPFAGPAQKLRAPARQGSTAEDEQPNNSIEEFQPQPLGFPGQGSHNAGFPVNPAQVDPRGFTNLGFAAPQADFGGFPAFSEFERQRGPLSAQTEDQRLGQLRQPPAGSSLGDGDRSERQRPSSQVNTQLSGNSIDSPPPSQNPTPTGSQFSNSFNRQQQQGQRQQQQIQQAGLSSNFGADISDPFLQRGFAGPVSFRQAGAPGQVGGFAGPADFPGHFAPAGSHPLDAFAGGPPAFWSP